MDISINLLKQPTGLTQSQYEKEEKIFRSSIIVFLTVIVLTIALFAWQFFTTSQLKSTQREIETTERQLSGLKDANDKQLYLKTRLQIIGEFLNSRINVREAIQQIFSIDIEGVSITGASFENERVVSLSLSSSNVLSLDKAYDYFEDQDLFFPQVINNGVNRTDLGDYSMTLELTIPFEG